MINLASPSLGLAGPCVPSILKIDHLFPPLFQFAHFYEWHHLSPESSDGKPWCHHGLLPFFGFLYPINYLPQQNH